MAVQELTIEDLKRVLREAAGQDEGVNLDGDVLDLVFEELGYDSLAVLEASSRIQREYGINLEDSAVAGAETPRTLLTAVNQQLAATAWAETPHSAAAPPDRAGTVPTTTATQRRSHVA
ncbi:acyl carrier protein [Actinomadura sp. HBU206391]|uniref:acyl carrier protein n=1 Tax=Actinomadura sp. HBU206391 TaxID=2731692 RepID=UPI0016500E6F|nr:acyl carrier protein [Actinomadura sp. HBU206391]MBC6456929.1 acyl carrier protein [Actinomadura sp. HBU206391]